MNLTFRILLENNNFYKRYSAFGEANESIKLKANIDTSQMRPSSNSIQPNGSRGIEVKLREGVFKGLRRTTKPFSQIATNRSYGKGTNEIMPLFAIL